MTITVNASTGITLPAGNASFPTITTTGDTNTGIFFPAADTIAFTEGGVEAIRIDSAGNTYIQTGNLWQYTPANTTKSTTATLTAAELLTGILVTTGTAYTVTVPTGTDIDAGWIGAPTTNIGFDFFIVNTASGTITVAINTGVTSFGALTILTGVSASFRFRRTAANTYVMYRLG